MKTRLIRLLKSVGFLATAFWNSADALEIAALVLCVGMIVAGFWMPGSL